MRIYIYTIHTYRKTRISYSKKKMLNMHTHQELSICSLYTTYTLYTYKKIWFFLFEITLCQAFNNAGLTNPPTSHFSRVKNNCTYHTGAYRTRVLHISDLEHQFLERKIHRVSGRGSRPWQRPWSPCPGLSRPWREAVIVPEGLISSVSSGHGRAWPTPIHHGREGRPWWPCQV